MCCLSNTDKNNSKDAINFYLKFQTAYIMIIGLNCYA